MRCEGRLPKCQHLSRVADNPVLGVALWLNHLGPSAFDGCSSFIGL